MFLYLFLILLLLISLWNLLPGFFHSYSEIIPDIPPENTDGVQYVGHGSVLIQIHGMRILTDPILTDRIAWVERRYISVGIKKEVLKTIDVILISHTHSDHYHIPSLKQLNPKLKIIVPQGVKKRLIRRGFQNVEELKIGDSTPFQNITISGVPTQHPSVRNAMGYIIQGSWSIYFPGDTALSKEKMQAIASRFKIDLALLPMGCYRGSILGIIPISYGRIHLSPDQLIQANQFLSPKVIVPIHWGTFNIGSEPIKEALKRLTEILKTHHIPVKIIHHGQWQTKEELLKGR